MTAIVRVSVSLRVLGDGLEPEEVSALLGRTPTRSCRKGDPVAGDGSEPAPTGAWIFESELAETTEIEEHVEALLGPISNDSDEWASLTERFSASILCVLRIDRESEVFEISPRLARSLADRGLVIAFEIHGPTARA